MSRLTERIYNLLTLDSAKLAYEFRYAIIIPIAVIITQILLLLLGWVEITNIIVWFLGALGMIGIYFYFRINLLDVFVQEEEVYTDFENNPDEQEEMTDNYISESTEEQMKVFSFNDIISHTFGQKDAEKMSSLMAQKDNYMLEEIK